MEIAVVSENGVRLKGKTASLVINPPLKTSGYNAELFLVKPDLTLLSPDQETLSIYGPGDYEIGGIKITVFKADSDLIYSMNIDGVDVMVGRSEALDRMHAKLKEHHIVIIQALTVSPTSYVTNFAPKIVSYFGEKAYEMASQTGKEDIKKESKLTITLDKLPEEMQEIVLA